MNSIVFITNDVMNSIGSIGLFLGIYKWIHFEVKYLENGLADYSDTYIII